MKPAFRALASAPSAQPARRAAQRSCCNPFANPFEGRGRGAAAGRRAAWSHPADMRHGLAESWSRLMRAKFASLNDCALAFDVTLQTAINWRDGGICRPAGDKVALAAMWWPEDFRRIVGGAIGGGL